MRRLALTTTMSFMVLGLWPGAGTAEPPVTTVSAGQSTSTIPKPKVIDCATVVTFNIMISSAKGISCRTAKKELLNGLGNISRVFKTGGGYRCMRVSGSRLAGQWRCTKGGSRAFRFEFSD